MYYKKRKVTGTEYRVIDKNGNLVGIVLRHFPEFYISIVGRDAKTHPSFTDAINYIQDECLKKQN